MAEFARLQVKISSEEEAWGSVGYGTSDYRVPTLLYGNTSPDASGTNYAALIDSSGHLQVDVVAGGGGGTQYTEGDTDATLTGTVALMEVAGNAVAPIQGTTAAGLLVNLGTNNDVTLPPITGSGSFTTVEDAVTLTLAGASNTAWQISGTWAGVISFEASVDGSNWVAIWGYQAGTTIIVQATTVSGIFRCTTAGFAYARARYSTDTSGTAVVTGYASHGTSGIFNNFPQYGSQMLGKQEDIASATSDTGTGVMAIQTATPANKADTEGDYEFLQMSAGRLWVSSIITGTPAVDTELPAAALLGDTDANPTAPAVGSFSMGWNSSAWERLRCDIGDDAVATGLQNVVGMMFDGSTYDRMRGTSADGLLVNLGTNNDVTLATLPDTAGGGIAAMVTSLGNLDNSVDGNYLNVNMNIAGTDVGVANPVHTKGVPSDIDINGSNANHADKYYTNAGAVTDGIVWSPAAGKRWHVTTLYINVSAAATVTLEDDLAGGDNARWKGELAANSGVVLTYDKEHPFSSAEDAADLIITTSAGNVYVQAVGYEV